MKPLIKKPLFWLIVLVAVGVGAVVLVKTVGRHADDRAAEQQTGNESSDPRQKSGGIPVVEISDADMEKIGADWPAPTSWPTHTTQPTTTVAGSLPQRLEKLAENFETATKSAVGMAVVDLRNGSPVVLHQADQPMTPASNQKILTSAFALAKLGADFKFTTGLFATDKDLVLAGDGDPLLGDPVQAEANNSTIYADLDAWAKQAREKLGQTVNGDLLVRTQSDPKNMRHPDWPKNQYSAWHCAPVADLNFNNNCYDVLFRLDGEQVTPVIEPASSFINIICNVKRGDSHVWSLRSSADESQVTLTGTVKSGGGDPLSTSAGNPPMLLARVLAGRLEKAGVKFTGEIKPVKGADVDLAKCKEIAVTTSPLSAAMARANKNSLNMTAECIFLRAGDGTWKGSAKMMHDCLIEKFGLDDQSLAISDGSGLAHTNKVSAASIARLLIALSNSKQSQIFLKSLAVSGVDGTMVRRMSDKYSRGRVLGKTGTIAGVSSLSGYILDSKGNRIFAFSILCNKVRDVDKARILQDAVCTELLAATSTTSPAPAYQSSAENN